MRFLLLADNHLRNDSENEPTPRLKWGLKALRRVHEYALAEGIDTVFHLGDFFDVPKPKPLTFRRALSLFWDFHEEDGPTWYFLNGNHDIISAKAGASYLGVLVEALPNAGFLSGKSEGGRFQMDNIQFVAVPYSTHAMMERQARQFIQKIPRDRARVLLTHATFQGVRHGAWRSPTGLTLGKGGGLGQYDLILTGHFHSHQVLGKRVVYPGSLHPHDFTRDQVTGFMDVVVEEDQTWSFKHIPIEEPRHHVIIRGSDKVENIVEDGREPVNGAYIKVVVKGSPEQLATTRGLRDELGVELMAMGALGVRWQLEPKITEESRITFDHETKLPDLVEQYVQNADTELNERKLIRLGVEYLS